MQIKSILPKTFVCFVTFQNLRTNASFLFSVCRTQNQTCNFNGLESCLNNQCICKPGYVGNLCQYCESSGKRFCMVLDNSVTEGKVNPNTGEGVVCSCKYINHLALFLDK